MGRRNRPIASRNAPSLLGWLQFSLRNVSIWFAPALKRRRKKYPHLDAVQFCVAENPYCYSIITTFCPGKGGHAFDTLLADASFLIFLDGMLQSRKVPLSRRTVVWDTS